MSENQGSALPPGVIIERPWSRRRKAILATALIVAVAVILVWSAWQLKAAHDAPRSLAPAGFGSLSISPCWAYQFYVDESGTLYASWSSNPNSTAELFNSSQYHTGLQGCEVRIQGTPMWVGKPNASSDSLTVRLGAGVYNLLFIPPGGAASVDGTSLSFTPSPSPWI